MKKQSFKSQAKQTQGSGKLKPKAGYRIKTKQDMIDDENGYTKVVEVEYYEKIEDEAPVQQKPSV